jgi:hypothetical protein
MYYIKVNTLKKREIGLGLGLGYEKMFAITP